MRKPLSTLKMRMAMFALASTIVIAGCQAPVLKTNEKSTDQTSSWKQQLNSKLPMLGHRNWILVVDKAFPEQNAAGMEYIYANEELLPVLKEVLTQVNSSAHIKPIIYQDKELSFITENQAKGLNSFLAGVKEVLAGSKVETLLHDEVFKKLDTEAKLFKVLVIKTNETIPYTSVFLQLDCAYWNVEKETQLRESMKTLK